MSIMISWLGVAVAYEPFIVQAEHRGTSKQHTHALSSEARQFLGLLPGAHMQSLLGIPKGCL